MCGYRVKSVKRNYSFVIYSYLSRTWFSAIRSSTYPWYTSRTASYMRENVAIESWCGLSWPAAASDVWLPRSILSIISDDASMSPLLLTIWRSIKITVRNTIRYLAVIEINFKRYCAVVKIGRRVCHEVSFAWRVLPCGDFLSLSYTRRT